MKKKNKESSSDEEVKKKKAPMKKKNKESSSDEEVKKKKAPMKKKNKESSSEEESTSEEEIKKKKDFIKKKNKESTSEEEIKKKKTPIKKKNIESTSEEESTSDELSSSDKESTSEEESNSDEESSSKEESSSEEEIKKVSPRVGKINKNKILIADINKIISDYDINYEFKGETNNYLDISNIKVLVLLTLTNDRIVMLYIEEEKLYVGVWNPIYWEKIFSTVISKKAKYIQEHIKLDDTGKYKVLRTSLLEDNRLIIVYKTSTAPKIKFKLYDCEKGVILQYVSTDIYYMDLISYIGNGIILTNDEDRIDYVWDCTNGKKSKVNLKNMPTLEKSSWEVKTYDKENYMYVEFLEGIGDLSLGKKMYFFGLKRGVWCKVDLRKAPFSIKRKDIDTTRIENVFVFSDGTVALAIHNHEAYINNRMNLCEIIHFNPVTNKIINKTSLPIKGGHFGNIFSISEDRLMISSYGEKKGKNKIHIYSSITHTVNSFYIRSFYSYKGTFPNGKILLDSFQELRILDITAKKIIKLIKLERGLKVITMTSQGGVTRY
jgi:hypothetical protein